MLRPDDVIEKRYRILGPAPLGQGGMGKVWMAKDQKVQMMVAVKEFELDSGAKISDREKDNLRKNFLKEAELLAGLEHEAFPKVRDKCFYKDVTPCIVMDFVSGDDLAEIVEQKKPEALDKDDVFEWCDQLFEALDYLHTLKKHPVIHKDIKPGNIKLTRNNRIKVLDFGIAKGYTGEMTFSESSVPMATLQYAPLEQVLKAHAISRANLSRKNADKVQEFLKEKTCPQTDIFAVCATLYRLLAGKPPENWDAVSRALFVWNSEPDPLPDLVELNPAIPLDLSAMIKRGMSLEIGDRYDSVATMRDILQEVRQRDKQKQFELEKNKITAQMDDEFRITTESLNAELQRQINETFRKEGENTLLQGQIAELKKAASKNTSQASGAEIEKFRDRALASEKELAHIKNEFRGLKEETVKGSVVAFGHGILRDIGDDSIAPSEEYSKLPIFNETLKRVSGRINARFSTGYNEASGKTIAGQTGRMAAVASILTILIPLPLLVNAYFFWPISTYQMQIREKVLISVIAAILSLFVPTVSVLILFIPDFLFDIFGKNGITGTRKHILRFLIIVFVCGVLGIPGGVFLDEFFAGDILGITKGNIVGLAAGNILFSLIIYRQVFKKTAGRGQV